jgi:hypothetical protein
MCRPIGISIEEKLGLGIVPIQNLRPLAVARTMNNKNGVLERILIFFFHMNERGSWV